MKQPEVANLGSSHALSGGQSDSSRRNKSRFSGLAPKLALAFAALALLAVMLEFVLRIQAATATPPARPKRQAYDIEGLRKLEQLADLTTPNNSGHWFYVPYTTNSYGFQGPEYSVDKPANIHRTIVIGDSVAMGHGVLARENFAARISRAFNTAPGIDVDINLDLDLDLDLEILNLAVAGYSSTNAADRYRDVGIQFRPDLVIYAFTSNDLNGLPGYRHTRRTNRVKKGAYQPANSASLLVRTLFHHWRRFRAVYYPAPSTYVYELDENYFRNPETWGHFESDLRRMKSMAESTGGRLLLYLFMGLDANQPFSPNARHYDHVEATATAQGIPVIRSNAYFSSDIERSSLQVSALDLHPNARGHLLLARGLADGLATLPPAYFPSFDVEALQQILVEDE